MSVVVTSTTVAILNVYVQPGQEFAPPTPPNFRWEGSRVASVAWSWGGLPAPHEGGDGWIVTLDTPTGDCFLLGAPNSWPNFEAFSLIVTCKGQGTPTEDRSVWYVSAMKVRQPFSWFGRWEQLPAGARSDSYYPIGA